MSTAGLGTLPSSLVEEDGSRHRHVERVDGVDRLGDEECLCGDVDGAG
jgi:hypothetical protein